jgi:hypothetical protein
MSKPEQRCMYLDGNGNCAILSQASELLSNRVEGKPTCQHPDKTDKNCPVADDWQNTPLPGVPFFPNSDDID